MERMYGLVQRDERHNHHHMLGDMNDMKATLDEIRGYLAEFEDVCPALIRSYSCTMVESALLRHPGLLGDDGSGYSTRVERRWNKFSDNMQKLPEATSTTIDTIM